MFEKKEVKKTSLHPDTFKKDGPTTVATKMKMTQESWEDERIRLSEEVKKAQQALWDHTHPVIEDPQVVAQQEAWEAKKKAAKK